MNDFEKAVKGIISAYKRHYQEDPSRYSIPIVSKTGVVGRLRPVPIELNGDASRDSELQTDWRNMHKDSFLVEPFTATAERTARWMESTYFPDDSMIMFMVEDLHRTAIGHLGFEHFDYERKICEYGRLMRGAVSKTETSEKINLLELAQLAALRWAFDVLRVEKIYARLFASNWMSVKLNMRCGFREVERFYVDRYDGKCEIIKIELTQADLV